MSGAKPKERIAPPPTTHSLVGGRYAFLFLTVVGFCLVAIGRGFQSFRPNQLLQLREPQDVSIMIEAKMPDEEISDDDNDGSQYDDKEVVSEPQASEVEAEEGDNNLDQDTKDDDKNAFVVDNSNSKNKLNENDVASVAKSQNAKSEESSRDSSETNTKKGAEDPSSLSKQSKKKPAPESKLDKFPECASSRRQEHPGVDDGPRVQYIHVPKAGGTSVQGATVEWVKRVSTGRCALFKYDGNAVRGSSSKCPPEAFDATVLTGHRGYGYCGNVERSARGLFTFTALREPVSRMISSYDYYLYRIEDERAVAVFGKQGLELGDIVKKYNATEEQEWGEKLIRYSGQQQARFLCGYDCMGPLARGNKAYTEEYILERALQNLEKVDAIGITAELNKLIYQLRFHLPQLIPKNFKQFKRENSHSKKSVLDDEANAILRQWAWVDVKLYERALEIHQRKQLIAEQCLASFGELEDETVSGEDVTS